MTKKPTGAQNRKFAELKRRSRCAARQRPAERTDGDYYKIESKGYYRVRCAGKCVYVTLRKHGTWAKTRLAAKAKLKELRKAVGPRYVEKPLWVSVQADMPFGTRGLKRARGDHREPPIYLRPRTKDESLYREVYERYASTYGRQGYAITADTTVLDAGACAGHFLAQAVKRKAKEVVCIEPSPANFDVLYRNAASVFRWSSEETSITLVRAALVGCKCSREVTLVQPGDDVSRARAQCVGRAGDVVLGVAPTTTMAKLKSATRSKHFCIAKFDIEGYENMVFGDCSQLPPQFSVEWHRRENARLHLEETGLDVENLGRSEKSTQMKAAERQAYAEFLAKLKKAGYSLDHQRASEDWWHDYILHFSRSLRGVERRCVACRARRQALLQNRK